eukprot:5460094-Alexandrium_andersonii.AAC.1
MRLSNPSDVPRAVAFELGVRRCRCSRPEDVAQGNPVAEVSPSRTTWHGFASASKAPQDAQGPSPKVLVARDAARSRI